MLWGAENWLTFWVIILWGLFTHSNFFPHYKLVNIKILTRAAFDFFFVRKDIHPPISDSSCFLTNNKIKLKKQIVMMSDIHSLGQLLSGAISSPKRGRWKNSKWVSISFSDLEVFYIDHPPGERGGGGMWIWAEGEGCCGWRVGGIWLWEVCCLWRHTLTVLDSLCLPCPWREICARSTCFLNPALEWPDKIELQRERGSGKDSTERERGGV